MRLIGFVVDRLAYLVVVIFLEDYAVGFVKSWEALCVAAVFGILDDGCQLGHVLQATFDGLKHSGLDISLKTAFQVSEVRF